jgi:hypothetical protein
VRRLPLVCLAVLVSHAAPFSATAQPVERAMISVNAAFQPTNHPFNDRLTFDVNRETGTTSARYPGEAGLVIDAGLSVGVWRNLGVGVAVSRFAADQVATTESDVPHPFFFNTPRQVVGEVTGLRRTELAVHADLVYRLPVGRAIRVALFAGPSFMQVEQDTITSIEYDESFPFDTATFRGAQQRRSSGSGVTFNAGADVAWMFTRHIGVGGIARFAEADFDLDLGDARSQRISAGGFSGGGGLRFVF